MTGLFDRTMAYYPQLNGLFETDLPDTPDAAKVAAEQFQTPDNMGFYRDYIASQAAKRADDLKKDRWLSLAQAGAVLAGGKREDISKAAQVGLGALSAANANEDKAAAAEMDDRLKLAGYEQQRSGQNMGLAKDMYLSGIKDRADARRTSFNAATGLASAEDTSARGWSALRQQDPIAMANARYVFAKDTMGLPEKDAQNYALYGSKRPTDGGQTWIGSALKYLGQFDSGAVDQTEENKAMAKNLRDKVNNYFATGQLPPEAMVDNEGGVAATPQNSPQISPAGGKTSEKIKMTIGNNAIAMANGDPQKAILLIQGSPVSDADKATAIEGVMLADRMRKATRAANGWRPGN